MTSATSSGTATAGPIARLRKPWLLLVALLSLGTASVTSAADYYFSSAGSDASGDGSIAKPWHSVAKFNQLTLHPGDSALFRAGDVFSGKMYLDAADSGTNASGQFIAPVKIGSYGATGTATRAKIVSPVNTEGFVAYNDGGIELSDLEFASGGVTGGQRTNGVQFISDKAASASLPAYQHIRVNNVVSHGFGMNGLQVWAHVGVGFSDVKVTNSEFYDNGYSGVYVGGTQWHGKYHSNVTIDHVVSHDNPGFSSKELPYTGNGIILAQTNGGLLQNSVGYGNGKLHGNSNGAIWIYGSDSIVVQHNLAYGNRSPDGYDGGAYDVDGGTTNSVFQYNRSYDNDGAGMLLAEYNGADPMSNNVYRYNLSVNDGKGAYGGITIWGNDSTRLAQSAVFHNNTVVVDRNFSSTVKGAVWFLGGNHKNVELINNTFVALNGAPLIAGDTSTSQSSIIGNSYWTAGGKIILEDQTYSSVAAWSNTSLQERVGGQFTGITSDPKFADSVLYRPQASSPLIDKGRLPGTAAWPAWITSLGQQDLAGAQVYSGAAPDVGAWEALPAGDFNGDGVVDVSDYTIWRDTNGSTVDLRADGNLNGVVDQPDFQMWIKNFGRKPGSGIGFVLTTQAPEPSTIILMVGALLPVWLSARRRDRNAA
jgi:Right handed beta helix region